VKTLILLNLAFFDIHPQIFFTVKRKVAVSFDVLFCEIASCMCFSFCILPFSKAADNKHRIEKKEQKQIFIFS